MPGLISVSLPIALVLGGEHAQPACPRQPLPPAIESAQLPPLSPFVFAIEFAATPTREYLGEAWVIRLTRRNERTGGTLDIARLRRQMDCNRYDVLGRWSAAVSPDEYARIAAELSPFALPPQDILVRRDAGQGSVFDGTMLTLRAQAPNWKFERDLNVGDRVGARLSPIFHALAARHVPADAMPTAEWRRKAR
jgi:hypothetical protein